jgi:uncharacterized phage-like protein YoqJ
VGHTSRWSAAQKHDYDLLLAKMNQVGNCKVVVVTPGDLSEYHDVCKALFARNEFMIDRADRVLACYDGRDTGGTKGAIAYAKKKKKVVGNILDFRI